MEEEKEQEIEDPNQLTIFDIINDESE